MAMVNWPGTSSGNSNQHADAGWRVIAPEGGHRFLPQRYQPARVGASWMTKEDRTVRHR